MGMMDIKKLSAATNEAAEWVVRHEPDLLKDEHYKAYLQSPVAAVWRSKLIAAQIAAQEDSSAARRAVTESQDPPLQQLYDDAKLAGRAALQEALNEPPAAAEQTLEIPDDPSSLFDQTGQA